MQTPEQTLFRWLWNDQNYTLNLHTPFFAVSGYQLSNEDVWMIHAARYPGNEHSWEAIAHALEYSGNICLSEQRVLYIDPYRPPRRPIEPKDVENEYNACLHVLHNIPTQSRPGPAPTSTSFHQALMERFWRSHRWYEQHKNDTHPW